MSNVAITIPVEILGEAMILEMVEYREVTERCFLEKTHQAKAYRLLVLAPPEDAELHEAQKDAMLSFARIIYDELGVPGDPRIRERNPYTPIWIYYCPKCDAHFSPSMNLSEFGAVRDFNVAENSLW